jgi:hypothetical protein
MTNPTNTDTSVPKTFKKAMETAEADEWKQATVAELIGLKKTNCYTEVDLPPGKKAIFSKWVYAKKFDSLGRIQKYKARCTCRGDMLSSEEFNEVSSPVVSWTGIRTFLALTTLYNLTPLQLDINLAYLNAPLEEEVYMYPPEGSSTPKGKVWKLNKSLYGLKQSGRNWYKLFTDVLTSQKFKFSQLGGDKCLFTRKIGNETTVLFIYVDDIYIASSTTQALTKFKEELSTHFDLKVLGVPSKLLGIQLEWGHDFKSVSMNCSSLIKDLLIDHNMTNCTPEPIPMRTNFRTRKADCPTQDQQKQQEFIKLKAKYQQLVGSFLFICNTCRPDICYATNQLCRLMSYPNYIHYDAALHLLRYLSGTIYLGIGYRSTGNRQPYFYADSDDGADETRRSCAGYMSFLADGPIYWKSKMLDALSLSSCESEIRAINMAMEPIKESIKMKMLLHEIEINVNSPDLTYSKPHNIATDIPVEILEDNRASIDWSKHTCNSTKMRHLERDLKWIQTHVANKQIKLIHIPTHNQIADIFTKPLASPIFSHLINRFMFVFKY